MLNNFDAIVIGSGIGGLTTASLLAQVAKKRVLVLESHFKLGGLTHEFQRHGYHWDVGLHYVGGMAEGEMTRRFMDLVTGSGVQWLKIADPLEHFIYPGHHLRVPSNEADYTRLLNEAFPDSISEIRNYFRLVHRAAGWMARWFASKQMPKILGALLKLPGKNLALQTTKQVLDKTIRSAELRGILASQWGDYGLPPSQSAFGVHAIVVKDYLKGGYVPAGGASQLARSIVPIIEQAGGKCLAGHKVIKLEIENKRVKQVWVERKGEQLSFSAPLVISAAGANKTFNTFIQTDVDVPERTHLETRSEDPTATNIYIGFNQDPRSIGMDAGNYWLSESYDHDALHAARAQLNQVPIRHCFLSAATLREPNADKHSAQIICFSDYNSWQQWRSQPWLNRDADYQQLKQLVAQQAFDLVERHLPRFREIVDYYEVSTPLSVESMTGHPRGAIYGLAATPQRINSGLFHTQTSIKNLLLSGSDVGSVGIVGAMMGGVMSAAWALGPTGFLKLLSAARKHEQAKAKHIHS